jgi:hypothetical protein
MTKLKIIIPGMIMAYIKIRTITITLIWEEDCKMNAKDIRKNDIYLGNALIQPVSYEKNSREVSYCIENPSIVYTCFDYELKDIKGIEHLMSLLESLEEKLTEMN